MTPRRELTQICRLVQPARQTSHALHVLSAYATSAAAGRESAPRLDPLRTWDERIHHRSGLCCQPSVEVLVLVLEQDYIRASSAVRSAPDLRSFIRHGSALRPLRSAVGADRAWHLSSHRLARSQFSSRACRRQRTFAQKRGIVNQRTLSWLGVNSVDGSKILTAARGAMCASAGRMGAGP